MKKHFLAGGAILLVTVVVLLTLTYTSAGKGLGAQLFGIGSITTKKLPPAPGPARQQGSSPTSPCTLSITPLTTPTAQGVPVGTNGFDFAHIKLTAPAGCNATLLHLTTGAMVISPSFIPTSLKNIKVYNLATGAQLGSTIVTPTIDPSQFNYSYDTISTNLSIPGGSSVTLAINADVIGATANLVQLGFTNIDAVQTGTTTQVGAGNTWWANDYWGQVMSLGSQTPCTPTFGFLAKWGSGGTGNGQFNGLKGITTDTSGNVYVADDINNRIQKFSASGTYLLQWGASPSTGAPTSHLYGMAYSSGNIFVADILNNTIRKFSATGAFISQIGTTGTGNGQFETPTGIAIDAARNIYVVDQANNRIQKFGPSGTYLLQWGTRGSGNGQFDIPASIAIDSGGNIYVVDSANNRIQRFGPSGTYLLQWGTRGSGNGQFISPQGITIDPSGNIYVSDVANSNVQKFSPSGGYLGKWGTPGPANSQFIGPYGISSDSSGNIFVADYNNNRVQKFGLSCPQS